jgi:hypothetical protein
LRGTKKECKEGRRGGEASNARGMELRGEKWKENPSIE